MKRLVMRTVIAAALLAVVSANAEVPRMINYQGCLTGSTGDPLDTTVSMTFAIYDDSTGGSQIWMEENPSVVVSDGLFNVIIGSLIPLDDAVFAEPDRWLGVTVGADDELTLRTRLVTVPYAFQVNSVDGASGGEISGSVTIHPGSFSPGDIQAAGKATIGPGHSNDGQFAFVAGQNNSADDFGAVSGGLENSAGGFASTVSGGTMNEAGGEMSMIPGGHLNTASGEVSFAAGFRAKAVHDGSFVWADGNDFDFESGAANELAARAIGGVRFVTGIDVAGNPNAGVHVAAGGGSWSTICDRNLKENFQNVDLENLLRQIGDLQIATWNYKAQGDGTRHIGPVAQDFFQAFGVGKDNRYIATVDADGVALAAIKALYARNLAQQQEIVDLKKLLVQLQADLEKLQDERK
jgi:hypothetical protein